jgi:hypothetical protein
MVRHEEHEDCSRCATLSCVAPTEQLIKFAITADSCALPTYQYIRTPVRLENGKPSMPLSATMRGRTGGRPTVWRGSSEHLATELHTGSYR